MQEARFWGSTFDQKSYNNEQASNMKPLTDVPSHESCITHKNRTTHRHIKRATTEVGLPASLAARLFLPRKPTDKNFSQQQTPTRGSSTIASSGQKTREKIPLAVSTTAILQGGNMHLFLHSGDVVRSAPRPDPNRSEEVANTPTDSREKTDAT